MIHNYQNFSSKVFPGFYNSIFEEISPCDEIPKGFYYEVKDFKTYQKEVCKSWVNAMSKNWIDNPIDIDILKFTGLDKPREYNFRTDRIEFNTDFVLQRLCKYCFGDMNKEFNDYLQKNWSSRSGFCSFVPSNIKRFKAEYSEWIDVMIEFYFLQNIDFTKVELDVFEELNEIIYKAGPILVDEKGKMWDYEYDNETNSLIPTKQIA